MATMGSVPTEHTLFKHGTQIKRMRVCTGCGCAPGASQDTPHRCDAASEGVAVVVAAEEVAGAVGMIVAIALADTHPSGALAAIVVARHRA